MASKPGMLSKFPWEDMGNFKYTLFLPFAIVAATGRDDADNWCWHMCGLAVARYALAQCFVTASRVHAISGKHRIQVRRFRVLGASGVRSPPPSRPLA